MREVILSADGDSAVYLVPVAVASDLRTYCISFCDKWMKTSPHAQKYRVKGGYCYSEADFIDYLNGFLFPQQPSRLVKSLGWTDLGKKLPPEYQDHPYFNF